MKALLVNGSPHPRGCTYTALTELKNTLEAEDIEVELLHVGNKDIRGCIACRKCAQTGKCVFDDVVNEVAPKLAEADAFVIGCPVYFASPAGGAISFMDRLFFSTLGIDKTMKVGAAVVTCRRGGNTASFDVLNKYFTICGMPIASSQYWNMVHGYTPDDVRKDEEGMQTMRNLARELELSPNLNIELNNSEVLSDAVDSLIEKLTPTSPVLAWLLDYIDERIRDDKRWNVSNEVKSFGRNIFDESYIERGEKLRQCLRTPNTLKLYRDVLRDMETEALEQMKSFYDQFEGELEGHALTPEDLKGGARGIGSYFRKLRDGRLSDKDVLNATLQNSLADAKNWATKTSSRKDDIICLAKTSLIPLLQEAERMRPQRNRTLNSCRLSLQHLNKLQLLNHIDEEVRTLNREHNRFLLSDTNALLHKLVREGDSSFVFEKIGANIRNVMIDEFQDTSRMQWDNFRLLLLEGLSQGADSLIVGDVKQSIYRWRNGDWGILNSLGNKELNLNSFPVRVETLKTNRRSETNIIRFTTRHLPLP